MKKIRKLFIANRGEIARRIALGARGLGLQTAAIYSGPAAPAFLDGLIDTFIKVPEESPAVYLNAALMVDLAKQAGADAVHPGFGFLSESAAFAALVEQNGLTWVGPSPASIAKMASKAEARSIAKAHKVPVVPGLEETSHLKPAELLKAIGAFADAHGFPILLKAAMGGGGKGMRVVRSHGEIEEAVNRAQSEALNSFGDSTLIVERYVEFPRHIEVQILGDQHGNVYALADRDCSVQRRHQKIIEEAPAPALTPETRTRMQEAAVNLSKAVGYYSAGTVEFIMDWSPDHRAQQNFYFLEMNTRLQVEHPVTEQIFNEDLVAWQLRIAQGESLKDRINLKPQGHSIELRLYAEDTQNRFLPAPGPVYGFQPYNSQGLRWETGIDAIDEVTPRFDPMIAKLIATGPTREHAIDLLVEALKRSILAMPISNTSFLLDVLQSHGFRDAQPTTRFIEDEVASLRSAAEKRRAKTDALAAQLWARLEAPVPAVQKGDAWSLTRAVFSKQAEAGPANVVKTQEIKATVPLRYGSRVSAMGHGFIETADKRESFAYCSTVVKGAFIRWLNIDGETYFKIEQRDEASASGRSGAHAHEIIAPVPGKIVKILVAPGSTVHDKQTVMILESMKMEFEVQATRSGTIAEILVRPGDQVQSDSLLAEWQKD